MAPQKLAETDKLYHHVQFNITVWLDGGQPLNGVSMLLGYGPLQVNHYIMTDALAVEQHGAADG